jgi:hypothetical protein
MLENRPEGLLCIPVPFVRLGGLPHQRRRIYRIWQRAKGSQRTLRRTRGRKDERWEGGLIGAEQANLADRYAKDKEERKEKAMSNERGGGSANGALQQSLSR